LEVPENIKAFISQAVQNHYGNADKETVDSIINEQLKAFAGSECQVYCKDCGLIFYFGVGSSGMLMDKRFLDWKMLAFRHAWDTGHKVKVASKYFTGANKVSLKVLATFGITGVDGQFDYSEQVRKLKERYHASGNPRLGRSFDENWTPRDVCVCSVCGETHNSPRDACYCCFGSKGWMPFSEVDKINVAGGE
jgi:hypothetical protein